MDKKYTLCVEIKKRPGHWIRHILTLDQLKAWLEEHIMKAEDYTGRFYVEAHQPQHIDGEETTEFPL